MIIIAISGKIGSGKDYLADIITKECKFRSLNSHRIAFSDPIKVSCYVDDFSYESLFCKKTEESRRALQTKGMEMRQKDDEIFVKHMKCQLRMALDRGVDVVIVTDLRFKVEFDTLQKLGANMIRLDAPQRTKEKMWEECKGDEEKVVKFSNHISETDLDDETRVFNYLLNNDYDGRKNEMNREIVDILEHILYLPTL